MDADDETAALVPSPSHLSIRSPVDVVLTSGDTGNSPIRSSPLPLSERLSTLTTEDVVGAAEAGHQTVLFTNVAGQLDYRRAQLREDGDGPDLPDPVIPVVQVFLTSPGNNTALHGSNAGVTFTATGSWTAESAASLALTLSVDGSGTTAVPLNPNGTWNAQVTITSSGVHTLKMHLSGSGWSSVQRKQINVQDSVNASLSVSLDPADPGPAPVLPTVTVAHPGRDTSYVDGSGTVTMTVDGSTTAGKGSSVTAVTVSDQATGASATTTPNSAGGWSVQLLLDGVGRHNITVSATDSQHRAAAPVLLVARVLASQPFRRLKNRLLLVETLNLSSFLASFGAGRVIKTFSLLPGEETTISMKSWTKSADSKKTGSSIIDSDATDAASSFEDALTAEQTNHEAQTEASAYKVGATASATWGWGSASINAEASGSANSAREEAVKNVSTATRKHSMKASSNRSVTVNTEYTTSEEAGSEESTIRKISNINASRTLNFVFRQMNQEHITLIHLTNVRVAFYTEDLALDADGKPVYREDPITKAQILDIRTGYQEVPLPQLQTLLDAAISPLWHQKVRDAITVALSGIPDYRDRLQTVFEWVTPTKDGAPVDGATYMRFPRNLNTDFKDPSSKQVITVPGIVLAYDHIVMRTEGVIVDSVLGQGEGLDAYSQGLQDVTVAERQIAVAERREEIDRAQLARQLVVDKNEQGAAIYAKLFPQQPPPDPTPTPTPTT